MFLNKIHREVHNSYPDQHDDLRFHIKLLLKTLGRKINLNDVVTFEKALIKAEEECWKNASYFNDTFNFIKKVKNSGLILCMTTGPNSKEKAQALETKISMKFFDYVFGEDNLGFIKSDSNYYKKAIIISGADPKFTVSIGDTISTDVIPAKEVGLKTIWVNRKTITNKNHESEPDYEVRNLNEAFECIQYLFNINPKDKL